MVVAGYPGRAMSLYAEEEGAGFIMSVVGATIPLAVYRMVKRSPA